MGDLEQLGWDLTKMNNLSLTTLFEDLIFLVLQAVTVIFICKIVINIVVLNSFFSLLFDAEYQVDP